MWVQAAKGSENVIDMRVMTHFWADFQGQGQVRNEETENVKLRSSLPEKESNLLYKGKFTPVAPLEMRWPCHTLHLILSTQHIITELLKAGYERNAEAMLQTWQLHIPWPLQCLSEAVPVLLNNRVRPLSLKPSGVSRWLNCLPSFDNSVASYVLNTNKYLQPCYPAIHIWDNTCRPRPKSCHGAHK